MANIALPTIQKALGYDDGTLQWVLTAYSLAVRLVLTSVSENKSPNAQLQFGGLLMAGGRLGDIFGHRNVLIFGMTLFNIATLICALVRDQIGFLIGRAFQGKPPLFVPPFMPPRLTLTCFRCCCCLHNPVCPVAGSIVIR